MFLYMMRLKQIDQFSFKDTQCHFKLQLFKANDFLHQNVSQMNIFAVLLVIL